MDYASKNREAWNSEVENNNYWTRIVDEDAIESAKKGELSITVTPKTPVPGQWLSELRGKRVLNLGGGGGQQTPLLSAWGAEVTVLDISDSQLKQDRKALELYGLEAKLVQGSMTDLGFEDECFDGVINPQSLNFIDDIEAVFKQVHRVLKKDGIYIFGIANPILYIFDEKVQEKKLKIKYTLPFSDTVSLSQKELGRRLKKKDTVEFSHTLDSIIGGLLKAGFVLEGFFSDKAMSEPTDSFIHDSHLAFKARRR